MEQANNIDNEQSTGAPRHVPPYMVSAAFGDAFLDEAACARFLLDMLHGPTPRCPECKDILFDSEQVQRYYSLKKITCPKCGKRPTAKKGTILENCSLSPRQYMLLSLLLDKTEWTPAEIGRFVGISDESVRQWRLKLYAR